MIKTKINVKNIVKSVNLVNLIETYTNNFLSKYQNYHEIKLNFNIISKDIDDFKIEILGNIDGKQIKSSFIGDDLIPILEIALRNFRNKSTKLNILRS